MPYRYKDLWTPTVKEFIGELSHYNQDAKITFEIRGKDVDVTVSPMKNLGDGPYTMTVCEGSYQDTVYVGMRVEGV